MHESLRLDPDFILDVGQRLQEGLATLTFRLVRDRLLVCDSCSRLDGQGVCGQHSRADWLTKMVQGNRCDSVSPRTGGG